MIAFTVPYNPLPKGRPRASKCKRCGTPVHMYTPKATREYESMVGGYAAEAMGMRAPFDRYVSLEAHFYRGTQHRVDCDNLLKAVSDAGNGLLYEDDFWIQQVHAYREYDPLNPRTEVFVREVG